MAEDDRCSTCDAERPANAPRGLCPRCLLRQGLGGEALSLAHPGAVGATVDLSAQHGVLETIAATVGPVPRVLLRDTDNATEPPVVRPATDAMPGQGAGQATRYQLLGEIARGGMGAVLKGRDPDLGRDLAVKVLLERHRDNPELVRRFVEEAQICGQLQHPGIVPVHELGTLDGRRPYFTMRLVKGRTLSSLLADRDSPAADLPRFLGIFEQVCQTVAYAHARGVIHRDLKPSNIMVGGFGEVQVMDWGLAKVLARGGVADETPGASADASETLISTGRGDSDLDLSRAGAVMGTPAYMAPEQARGEIDAIDERCDVFALGSILCELLTGQPAFVGRTSGAIQRLAARGDVADAHARLDACGADAELIALARDCLAPDLDRRPRHASALVERLGGYLASIEQRLRAAELERAAEAARAEEAQARAAVERSRRRRTVALAAVILVSTTLVGVAVTYEFQRRQARVALAQRIGGDVTWLLVKARDHPEDMALWQDALNPLRQIDTSTLPPALRAWLDGMKRQAESGRDTARLDQPLLAVFAEVRMQEPRLDRTAADPTYARAFQEAGVAVEEGSPSEVAAAVRRRSPRVVAAAVAALDDWALARLATDPADPRGRRLLEIARAADPDSFRVRVRDALLSPATAEQAQTPIDLAAAPQSADLPAPSALLLARALQRLGATEPAISLLRRTTARHPSDFWPNFAMAELLMTRRPPAREEAIGYYRAARALRPETGEELARWLEHAGRVDEATAVIVDTLDRRWKGEWTPLLNLCLDYRQNMAHPALLERIVARGRLAVQLYPTFATAHLMLGVAMLATGRTEEAIAAFEETIRLDRSEIRYMPDPMFPSYDPRRDVEPPPDEPIFRILGTYYAGMPWALLGLAHQQRGDFAEGLAAFRVVRDQFEGGPFTNFDTGLLAPAERMAALADRLPAVLRGDDRPADQQELLDLIKMTLIVRDYAAAARLHAELLDSDATLAGDVQNGHRYDAACYAALAASGRGQNAPPPGDPARAALRGQALGWLRADLAIRAEQLATDPATARAALEHWKRDYDLAGVRDLAALPEAERAAWEALWREVDDLLDGAVDLAREGPWGGEDDAAGEAEQPSVGTSDTPASP